MDKNAELIEKAGLLLAEVFALRLYTGPMYLWFVVYYFYSVAASSFVFDSNTHHAGIIMCFVTAKALPALPV